MDGTENRNKLKLSIDLRFIIIILLLVIVGMLIIWKPWDQAQVSDRTIDVTGEATLKAMPEEYAFMPNYEFTNVDKAAALKSLTQQSDTIIAKLKDLGVSGNQIKTDTLGGQRYYSYIANEDKTSTYTLQFTVTVGSSSLAQKIQDYLTTTSPTGPVSPQVNFSGAQQKRLDGQARDKATKDARSKADQSAKNLGFKVGSVKSVTDGSGFGGPIPYATDLKYAAGSTSAAEPSLAVQPGQNELSYSVKVVYYIH